MYMYAVGRPTISESMRTIHSLSVIYWYW